MSPVVIIEMGRGACRPLPGECGRPLSIAEYGGGPGMTVIGDELLDSEFKWTVVVLPEVERETEDDDGSSGSPFVDGLCKHQFSVYDGSTRLLACTKR